MIQALIFDMDGIVADTERLHMIAHERFLARYGYDVPWRWFAQYIGTPTRQNIAEFKRLFNLPGSVDELYHERDDILIEVFDDDPLEPLPGFLEAVEEGRRRRLKLGLCSSSSLRQVRSIMERLCQRLTGSPSMGDVFQAVTHGGEVTHAKPAPDLYQLSCRRLAVEPPRALAIEDSVPGVASAVAAGCLCVAIPQEEYSSGLDYSKAHYQAGSLKEVIEKNFYGLLSKDGDG